MAIRVHAGEITPSQLAALEEGSRPTMARTVSQLEKLSMIRRVASTHDGRSAILSATHRTRHHPRRPCAPHCTSRRRNEQAHGRRTRGAQRRTTRTGGTLAKRDPRTMSGLLCARGLDAGPAQVDATRESDDTFVNRGARPRRTAEKWTEAGRSADSGLRRTGLMNPSRSLIGE
ncbi:MarR family transcriptional regulator [Nonomuraea jabiensis]|uniref:MarR family transcriptional regulator n=1 Tax=Nonomuraea jabiensis TaxID=882448 RepID=UPI003D75EC19